MKKITLLNLLLFLCTFYGFGQTMVDDFESGSGGLLSNAGNISSTVVTNPNPSGINTTANCLELKRTSGTQWWILAGINVDPDLAISNAETKYLSMMVYYPAQPDLGCRFAGPDDNTNGAGGSEVRALNTYKQPFNTWQEIVFEIKDNTAATSFNYGTLYRIDFHPDMGFQNDPVGQVLSDPTIAGYIDQIQILDSNPLLSTSDFEINNDISLYPNPTQSEFTIKANNRTKISSVSIFNTLGTKIDDVISLSENKYDISHLSSGLYLVKVFGNDGTATTMKLLKN
ncbi:T9SS type A sorting domain-containing protein [Aestuariivivens insulae]|uniref:T9SS type A sorting domain-containing protein n=1 Tax=Aestuariivivens insulae TaxID=1621988 RepID=UPI001F56E385|nr:T9SS type A sorting domain-containing protein [Aestuariivivens insulae]